MIPNAGHIDGKQLMMIPLNESQMQALAALRSPPTWFLLREKDEFGNCQVLIDIAFDISRL
jgi:hypothetical protein